MEDLTGKQLGPYRIVGPLGQGGMATVFRAFHPPTDRYVALKVLPREYSSDPSFLKRFHHEARILASLQHPHILAVHDFGEAEGYTFIVMPLVETGTLSDLLQGRPLTLEQIRTVITQIGSALDYAHKRGLLHRDVKPSNVLIDESGNCLLSDFGLAKIVTGSSTLTSMGAILGTPAYMSPEQGQGLTLDARTDLYSLGVILYEMSTGLRPFDAETPMAVVVKHIHDALPPPRLLNPKLPAALETVILKALAKQPEDRYASVVDFIQALQTALSDFIRPGKSFDTAFPPAEQPQTLPGAEISTGKITAAATKVTTSPSTSHAARKKILWITGSGLILLLGVAGILVAILSDRSTKASPATSASGPALTSPSGSCPETIQLGLRAFCEISAVGEINLYKLPAEKDEWFYFLIFRLSDEQTIHSYQVNVLDPDAREVIPGIYTSNSEIEQVFSAPASGIYSLSINDADLKSTSHYLLYVQKLGNPSGTASLQVGEQRVVTASEGLQLDPFSFDAQAGQEVAIDLSMIPPDSDYSARAVVYSPEGKLETEGGSHGGLEVRFTASTKGTYFMLVHEFDYTYTGKYSVLRLK